MTMRYIQEQEIFPAAGNISCGRNYFLGQKGIYTGAEGNIYWGSREYILGQLNYLGQETFFVTRNIFEIDLF